MKLLKMMKNTLFSQDEYVFDSDNFYAYKDSTYEFAVDQFVEMYNILLSKCQEDI